MGECKAGIYINNNIITHSPLVCFGGFGQLACRYVEECMTENNMKMKKKYRVTKWHKEIHGFSSECPTCRGEKGK